MNDFNIDDLYEKMKESADEYIKELIETEKKKEQEKRDFISTKQINIVMEKLYNVFKSERIVELNSNDYSYNTPKLEGLDITKKEFYLLFDIIKEYGDMLGLVCQEEYNQFPHKAYCLTYKDVNIYFRVMSGQGTIYQIWCLPDEDSYWQDGMSFTYSSLGYL